MKMDTVVRGVYLAGETLFIVPYPTSRQPVMIFKTPRAATIIGRIIHVWPPLVALKKILG